MRSYMNWSGGKDSALALYYSLKEEFTPDCLSTNINAQHNRISMHGVRRSLLEAQADSIGLPLHVMKMPEQASMKEYEESTEKHIRFLKDSGYTNAVFGDIFLEDLKAYRETQLKSFGISCSFPLWKNDPGELMKEFITLGFKAIVVCVNGSLLDKSFCGRLIDQEFLNDLPGNVDVCGENGEYHSFVFDGPLFTKPVEYTKGSIVKRSYLQPGMAADHTPFPNEIDFYFCDLIGTG
jgi:uncharacterized protein (TIGR00290 family)